MLASLSHCHAFSGRDIFIDSSWSRTQEMRAGVLRVNEGGLRSTLCWTFTEPEILCSGPDPHLLWVTPCSKAGAAMENMAPERNRGRVCSGDKLDLLTRFGGNTEACSLPGRSNPAEDGGPWSVTDNPCSLSPRAHPPGSGDVCFSAPRSLCSPPRHF